MLLPAPCQQQLLHHNQRGKNISFWKGPGLSLRHRFRCAPLLSLRFAGAEQPGGRLSRRKELLPSLPFMYGTIKPCKLQVTLPTPATAWGFVRGAASAMPSIAEQHLQRPQGMWWLLPGSTPFSRAEDEVPCVTEADGPQPLWAAGLALWP